MPQREGKREYVDVCEYEEGGSEQTCVCVSVCVCACVHACFCVCDCVRMSVCFCSLLGGGGDHNIHIFRQFHYI